MKIQIEQAEIEKAVKEYINNQGIKIDGKDLSVEFRMTRVDGGGLVANLSIDDPKPVETKAPAKPRLGSVGAAIAKQSEAKEKPDTKPAATAKAAIEQALSAAEDKSASAGVSDSETVSGDTAGGAAEAGEGESTAAGTADADVAGDAAAVEEAPKKTTSLFS